MSRQPTAGKFSFTKASEHRGSQGGIKSPDFVAKTQIKVLVYIVYYLLKNKLAK